MFAPTMTAVRPSITLYYTLNYGTRQSKSGRTIHLPTASGRHEEKMQVRPTISANAGDGACYGACAVRMTELALR